MFNNFYIILKQFNRNIWQDWLDMLFIANQTLLFLHVKCMRFRKDKMIEWYFVLQLREPVKHTR